MKRSPLLRRTELRAKEFDAAGNRRFSTFAAPSVGLATTSLLARTSIKRKPRRAKPGDEPLYKAWVKTLPCCVGGERCRKADPHHLIDGNGDARKGMSQTAPDRYLLPMCRMHHDLFHAGKGVFAHFVEAQRLTFQEQECERLRAIWAGLTEFGVWQEPLQKAV